MTYVVGDVHGNYHALLALMQKIPKKSRVIFVGDLIDRGEKSKEVIQFVRKSNYECVRGNHEDMMIKYTQDIFKKKENYFKYCLNGGRLQTLQSYGLINKKQKEDLHITKNQEKIQLFKNDIAWMKKLPLYIKLNFERKKKPIVISHACVANVWKLRNSKKDNTFKENALYNRDEPSKNAKIFNIYGHTPIEKIDLSRHFINIDTGCCYKMKGMGRLSAYCIEEHKVVSVACG